MDSNEHHDAEIVSLRANAEGDVLKNSEDISKHIDGELLGCALFFLIFYWVVGYERLINFHFHLFYICFIKFKSKEKHQLN